jgi:hypothetical protein
LTERIRVSTVDDTQIAMEEDSCERVVGFELRRKLDKFISESHYDYSASYI